ncbi:SGNH/GDSL hydrolase family protein [Acidobacteria bacterium AH-259-A15]|nr:SGNH/GDSL hydrolase family protein [Acidobacteria bacterium AH-259-A15]
MRDSRLMMHRTIIVPHPQFGFWYVPNQYAYVPHQDRGYYVVQTNRIGVRSCREFTFGKPANIYRILVFGDSFTAADGVHNCERYSDVLESLDKRLEVINFGLPGSGTDQQLLIYEQLGRRFEADLLLFCPVVENIQRNLTRHRSALDRTTGKLVLVPKPYFTLEAGKLVLHHSPVPTKRFPFDEAPDVIRETAMFQTPGAKNPRTTLGRLANALERWSGGSLSPMVEGAARLRYRLLYPRPYPEYDSPTNPAWCLMRAILKRFIVEAGGREVILAPLPNHEYIESDNGQPTYLDRFRELACEHPEVTVVDVLAWMRDYTAQERRNFRFQTDLHYTPKAHEVVGRGLYEACVKQKVEARSPSRQLGKI